MRGTKKKPTRKRKTRLIYSAIEESFIDRLYGFQLFYFWAASTIMMANSLKFYEKEQIGVLVIQVLILVYFFWVQLHYARVWRKGLDYPVARRNLRITITISQVAFFASLYLMLYGVGEIARFARIIAKLGISSNLSSWLSHILTIAAEGIIGNTAFALVKRYIWNKVLREKGITSVARGGIS